MAGRRRLPDIMSEALGWTELEEAMTSSKVVQMPQDKQTSTSRPLLDKMKELRLLGMARALEEQTRNPGFQDLGFEDRLDPLLERERRERQLRAVEARIKRAGLRLPAGLEDLDYAPGRGLESGRMEELASCRWIVQGNNLIVWGGVGSGKTFLSCALAREACRKGHTVLYRRLSRTVRDLENDRDKAIRSLSRPALLVLDDWGLEPLGDRALAGLLELAEARSGRKSILLASQLAPESWAARLGESPAGRALLDRLTAGAHMLGLGGPSRRSRGKD